MSSNDTQKKSSTKETTDSEISDTPGKRSRSQSRRARRRKAQQKSQEKKPQMPSLNEDGEEEESSSPETEGGAMQPLQHIGGDEKSMDGPVTHARAQRGELPLRGGKPNQGKGDKKEGGQSDEMMKQDGLKLRLELNLDIELELKASIRGDITLALLN